MADSEEGTSEEPSLKVDFKAEPCEDDLSVFDANTDSAENTKGIVEYSKQSVDTDSDNMKRIKEESITDTEEEYDGHPQEIPLRLDFKAEPETFTRQLITPKTEMPDTYVAVKTEVTDEASFDTTSDRQEREEKRPIFFSTNVGGTELSILKAVEDFDDLSTGGLGHPSTSGVYGLHSGKSRERYEHDGQKIHSKEKAKTNNESGELYKGKKFGCDKCSKSFKRKFRLIRHIRTHTRTERPYKCDICSKTFSYFRDFNEHKRIHTGVRPYECDACGKTFTHASNFIRHRRVHTGEKPNKCDKCGKTFTRPSYLAVHKSKHR